MQYNSHIGVKPMLRPKAGQGLSKDFIELYLTEQLSAVKLCEMARRHTVSGGVGLEDVALIPSSTQHNHNAHVQLCFWETAT